LALVFLTLAEIVEIHRDQIARYGGHPGIRDARLLQAAIAVPRATMGGEYLHTDPLEMAAAYLYHIVRNHPFVDGNKRAGAVAALVFLDLNGVKVDLREDQLVRIVLAVAEGNARKSDVAGLLRRHQRRMGGQA
jgi:death-on-curing protein